MRLLLDENIPVRLAGSLADLQLNHVRDLGWLGISDRELAIGAAGVYDVIVTLDQTFPAELTGLTGYPAIIVLSPRSHRLIHVAELLPRLREALTTIAPGEVVRISRV